MAASFTIAARNNGFTPADEHAVTVESVEAYREAMGEFAAMRTLDIWYAHLSEHDIQEAMQAVQKSTEGAAGSKTGKGKGGKKRASKDRNESDSQVAKSIKVARRRSGRRTLVTACRRSPDMRRSPTAGIASSISRR